MRLLSEGRSATQLSPDGRAALKGEEVRPPEDLRDWLIVEETPQRVALIRELGKGEGGLPGATHAFLSIERFGPPDADGRPGWHMRTSGQCELRYPLAGLSHASMRRGWTAGTKLQLLVTERACASGKRADGRVRLVELQETAQEVRVVVGVVRQNTPQTCPGNPKTPFTVELAAPLGSRKLVDAGIHPIREIRP